MLLKAICHLLFLTNIVHTKMMQCLVMINIMGGALQLNLNNSKLSPKILHYET